MHLFLFLNKFLRWLYLTSLRSSSVNILAASTIAAVVFRAVEGGTLSGLIVLGQVWLHHDFMLSMRVRALF
jgi:hypothetical protein